MKNPGYIRRVLLGLPPGAIKFEQRGFCGDNQALCQRLENVGGTFLAGYHLALEQPSLPTIHSCLTGIGPEQRGFAYEGAAMGLAMRERLTPWPSRLVQNFLAGEGSAHTYMIHVGIGWVWARFPFGFRRWHKQLDPLLGWLAFDGWGFHEGYFHWRKYITGKLQPKKLSGYELRAFDQGFGRSLWFVLGGRVDLIAATVSNFSVARQADLWSGLGLAAACAGIISESELQTLRLHAGKFQPQLAQGAAFAAKVRQRAGNPAAHTNVAALILCEMSAEEAAQITDAALENLPADAELPAYEIWRQRIQAHFQNHFAVNHSTPAAV